MGGSTSGNGAEWCSAVDVGEGTTVDGASALPILPIESEKSRRLASLTRLCMDIEVAELEAPVSGEEGGESGRGVDVGDKGCHTTSTLAACTCLDFAGA